MQLGALAIAQPAQAAARCGAVVRTDKPVFGGEYNRPGGSLSVRSGPHRTCQRLGTINVGERLTYWCKTNADAGTWVYLTNESALNAEGYQLSGWSKADLLSIVRQVQWCNGTGLSALFSAGSSAGQAPRWCWDDYYSQWVRCPQQRPQRPPTDGNTWVPEGGDRPSDQSGPEPPSSWSS